MILTKTRTSTSWKKRRLAHETERQDVGNETTICSNNLTTQLVQPEPHLESEPAVGTTDQDLTSMQEGRRLKAEVQTKAAGVGQERTQQELFGSGIDASVCRMARGC